MPVLIHGGPPLCEREISGQPHWPGISWNDPPPVLSRSDWKAGPTQVDKELVRRPRRSGGRTQNRPATCVPWRLVRQIDHRSPVALIEPADLR